MKKILRSGADKVFYTICRNCSTEFTYQLADTTTEQLPLPILQNLFSSDSDVPQKEQKAVVCPLCAEVTPATLTPYDSVFKPQPMAGFGFGGV